MGRLCVIQDPAGAFPALPRRHAEVTFIEGGREMSITNSVRGAVITGVIAVAAATVAFVSLRAAPAGADIWNARASAELTTALHKMHEVWDTGDITVLKQVVSGDDALVTFELDPATHTPIRLASKQDLHGFIDAVTKDAATTKAEFRLETPVVHCKASDVMGVCTEECTVHQTTPDGVEKVHRLWSTATAVKRDGAWKWVQWHMSLAAPTQTFRNGALVSSGNE
jgi:hypothetical protein